MFSTGKNILEVSHLQRTFNNFVAVDDVSFTVQSGEIFALLGPNGAGKTTTIKMCSTMLVPTSGSIFVDGVDAIARPRQARQLLSLVLGGDLGFYGRASAYDNLLYFADIAGVKRNRSKKQIDELLDLLGLHEKRDAEVRTLSRGQTQRLHLARGLIGDTKLLLLDEPSTGLDPEAAHSLRAVIKKVQETGVAILLTSHSMSEVEELADTIQIINDGRIVHKGDALSVAKASGVYAIVSFSFDLKEVLSIKAAIDKLKTFGELIEKRGQRVEYVLYCMSTQELSSYNLGDIPQLTNLVSACFTENNLKLPYDLVVRPPHLEESYLRFIANKGEL